METLHALVASVMVLFIGLFGGAHQLPVAPITATSTSTVSSTTAIADTAFPGTSLLNATNTFYIGDKQIRNRIDFFWMEYSRGIDMKGIYMIDQGKIRYYSDSAISQEIFRSTGKLEIISGDEGKGRLIEGADVKTFTYLGYGYAKDKNSIYLDASKVSIVGIDIKSVEALDEGLLRDSKNIYFDDRDQNTGDLHQVSISNNSPKAFSRFVYGKNPFTSVIKGNPEETIKRDYYNSDTETIYKFKNKVFFNIHDETESGHGCGYMDRLYYLDIQEEKYYNTDVKYCGSYPREGFPIGVNKGRDIDGYYNTEANNLYAFNFETAKEFLVYERKNNKENLISNCFLGAEDGIPSVQRNIENLSNGKLRIGVYKDQGIDPCTKDYKPEKIRDDVVDLTKF